MRVAASAKWARERAKILRDVHWVGGDPGKLEPYGWAAWSPGHGTLVLRNPSEQEQSITIDIAGALDLPTGEPTTWKLSSPFEDQRVRELVLRAGEEKAITLQPFEVLVFDAHSE